LYFFEIFGFLKYLEVLSIHIYRPKFINQFNEKLLFKVSGRYGVHLVYQNILKIQKYGKNILKPGKSQIIYTLYYLKMQNILNSAIRKQFPIFLPQLADTEFKNEYIQFYNSPFFRETNF
jgi:hypothetical protein